MANELQSFLKRKQTAVLSNETGVLCCIKAKTDEEFIEKLKTAIGTELCVEDSGSISLRKFEFQKHDYTFEVQAVVIMEEGEEAEDHEFNLSFTHTY